MPIQFNDATGEWEDIPEAWETEDIDFLLEDNEGFEEEVSIQEENSVEEGFFEPESSFSTVEPTNGCGCPSCQRRMEQLNQSIPTSTTNPVCETCERRSYTVRFRSGIGIEQYLCNACVNENYRSCDYCRFLFNREDHACSRCGAAQIYSYSYKPKPIFHGEGPLFLGAEIEIEAGSNYNRQSVSVRANIAQKSLGNLGYLKEDGSIHYGFEIVTHPMSYHWAMDNFPWPMFKELSDYECYAGESCGMHVHVSRAGFACPSHIYRWMKFFYRNQREIKRLARRDPSNWGAFTDYDRRRIKDYAKNGAYGDRYTAINAQPSETFEIRIFASSLEKTEIQAALALADASIEYTRNLTANEIIKNGGWDWPQFSKWVAKNPDYAPLKKEMEILGCAY